MAFHFTSTWSSPQHEQNWSHREAGTTRADVFEYRSWILSHFKAREKSKNFLMSPIYASCFNVLYNSVRFAVFCFALYRYRSGINISWSTFRTYHYQIHLTRNSSKETEVRTANMLPIETGPYSKTSNTRFADRDFIHSYVSRNKSFLLLF